MSQAESEGLQTYPYGKTRQFLIVWGTVSDPEGATIHLHVVHRREELYFRRCWNWTVRCCCSCPRGRCLSLSCVQGASL